MKYLAPALLLMLLCRGATAQPGDTYAPGDDFFAYANQDWIQHTTLPATASEWGAFDEAAATTQTRLETLITADDPADPTAKKVHTLFDAFMTRDKFAANARAHLARDLARIAALPNHDAVARWMAKPASSSLVAINVFPDSGHQRRFVVYLDQNNLHMPILGLGKAEYDTPDSEKAQRYRAYVASQLQLAGMKGAPRRAAAVFALEAGLAKHFWTFEKVRDRRANYHLLTARQLPDYAPGFPWAAFLAARGIEMTGDVVLGDDTAVREQAAMFKGISLQDWKSYLAFHWIQNHVAVLPQAFGDANFAFYGKAFRSDRTQPPSRTQAIDFVNHNMGMAVGRLYAARYFSAVNKARAAEMFGYLKTAFREAIVAAQWMDDATRQEALHKLDSFTLKIGFPAAWRSYDDVTVRQDDLYDDFEQLKTADWNDDKSFLQKPPGTESWYETPQTVDASYSPLTNAIELPAAILQPTFFDPDGDVAANFGSIGATIGHEMGHAFDDQGANFAGDGEMHNWWSDASRAGFEKRTAALAGHYDRFEPFAGLHVDGKRTIGENIGDLTGVSLSYRAMQLYLRDHPPAKQECDVCADRRFFLSWAHTWRYIGTDDTVKYIVKNSYHAPARYRVNGVVQNLDAWYRAFNITLDAKLYLPPEQRVTIW